MRARLQEFLPTSGEAASSDALLGRFLEWTAACGLGLYPTQEAAILELFEGKNVILNTPTGSGKSLVAFALHFQSLAQGRRSVYTCPIKALVNEKWRALCAEFGPHRVGLSTGDASVNRTAPILCCTAEILANAALRAGADSDMGDVVMDEFHYYSDRERGVAWQAPLLVMRRTRFLLMSATLGETSFFESELTALNGRATAPVRSVERPVPLDYNYVETPPAQTVERLLGEGRGPIYVVHFTQAEAAQSAQDFMSLNVSSREERQTLAEALADFKFASPYGADMKRWLRQGIGLHHAGLLPKYRVLVEKLSQRGLLKVICGTDTLGVGINVPIRTVLLTRLCKYDGEKTAILSARDFHQITGRAGRKGFDEFGWVIAQAPEHVVENLKLEEKKAKDGRKIVKRKPPDKNFVSWDKKTFQRLQAAAPERLASRFQVSHAMLLNVLSRPGDGCAAMRDLIRRCHESPRAKAVHTRRAWQLFRSLLERRIIEFVPRTAAGSTLRVNVALQEDFSMDQTLSLYLLETLPRLNPDEPTYALDVLTLVESILEDPDAILRRQLDKLKARRLAEMKLEGMDYEARMAELELMEHPKPLREFVYATFNEFARQHPWVGQENIRPKSIAREMVEQFRTFADYVRDYELQRVEGLLLRHLSGVHKVLCQTVPDAAKTEPLRDIEVYLGTLIRQVDSSLLDEWELMRDPTRSAVSAQPAEAAPAPPGAVEGPTPGAGADPTRDRQRFEAAVRARIFLFLRALQIGDLAGALESVDWIGPAADTAITATTAASAASAASAPACPPDWNEERLRHALARYQVEHERISLDPEARNRRHTYIRESADRRSWQVDQVLVDPAGLNDWAAAFEVDLPSSRAAGEPKLGFLGLGPVGNALASSDAGA